MLAWAAPARAQGWLSDRRFAEGPGIKAGDFELHPGIGAEAGYDSNWFLRSSNTGPNLINGAPAEPVREAAVIRITPSFYVSTLGIERQTDNGTVIQPRFVTFRGGVSATGIILMGKEMSDQSNVALNADGRMDINPGHPVAFGLFGAYSRVIQPNIVAQPDFSFNRDDVRLGADLTFLPGGGSFDIRAGYQFMGQVFEQTQGVPYTSITNEVFVRDRWKFRPRTALFSEASLDWIDYPDAQRATFYLNDATPLRTRAGLTGLLTDWFGTTLAAGYSATFFKNPNAPSSEQYDSLNAQAEANFYLSQGKKAPDLPGEATLLLSTLSFGYTRDFQRSLVGNFYTSDRIYGRLEYWFGGRFVINASAFGEKLDYPPVYLTTTNGVPTNTPATGDFTNWRVGGRLFAEYRFSEVFGLNATVDYVHQFSDTLLPNGAVPGSTAPAGSTASNVFYDQNYGRLQAFLGFRYFY